MKIKWFMFAIALAVVYVVAYNIGSTITTVNEYEALGRSLAKYDKEYNHLDTLSKQHLSRVKRDSVTASKNYNIGYRNALIDERKRLTLVVNVSN